MKENYYLEIRQVLTDEQATIWQPIEGRKLVTDEAEARQILSDFVEALGLTDENYTLTCIFADTKAEGVVK